MLLIFLIEILILIIPLFLTVYSIYYVICDIKGAPYVPTKSSFLNDILKTAKLKKGQIFIELGSGDGRVVRKAVKEYEVIGIGYDINPILIYYSRLISYFQKIRNVNFYQENLYKVDVSQADVIFLFLLPRTVKKLREKLEKECKKKTLVISHGFPLYDWEKKIIHKIERKPFSTFFYRL